MWPFGNNNTDSPTPRTPYMVKGEIDLIPDYRHIDVDLYYRMGEVDKAQEIARELRPLKVGSMDGEITDEELERIRDAMR